jgi:Ca-activated chloride channel family protein
MPMTEPLALLCATTGRAMSLKGVTAHGRISGLLLSMTVRQAYRNDTPDTLETVYTFPLAWGAVMMGLAVEIAGRRLAGTVLPAQQAQARYEEAIAGGDTPIMVERSSDQLYTASLGNLKPGEEAVIEVRYAQLLRVEQGRVRVSVPTTIAPRYGDPARDAGIAGHESVGASLSAEYPFELQVVIDGPLGDGTIESPTHPIAVSRTASGVLARLARSGWLDRDVVLTVEQPATHAAAGPAAPGSAGTAQAVGAPDAGGCVVLASFCPSLGGAMRESLDLKILVDCSGSMGGDSIASARRGLARVLAELRGADRFSFSRFGSLTLHTFTGLRRAEPAALAVARAAVAATDATLGGTELADALESTFALPGAAQADVLLITDGSVWAIDAVVAAAKAAGHRIFAVGVGSAPAESLLRQLAESTGGACELVAPDEAIEAAVSRMFARLRAPRASQLAIDWGAAPAWATRMPDGLFDGDTVHVFAGFDTVPAGLAPQLRFTLGADGPAAPARPVTLRCAPVADAPAARAAPGPATPTPDDDSLAAVLPRIAAWQRIAALGRRRGARASAQAWALELALRHQLVTDDTHLFLVHQRADADKATDQPSLQQIGHMVAAGWGATGSVSQAMDSTVLYSRQSPGAFRKAGRSAASRPDVMRSPRIAGPSFSASLSTYNSLERFVMRNEPPVAREAPAAPPRPTPLQWLAPLADGLRDASGLDALATRLASVPMPEGVREAIDALVKSGVPLASAWVLVLAWLAACAGDDAVPGARAMAVLDALVAAMPESVREAGMRIVAEQLGEMAQDDN